MNLHEYQAKKILKKFNLPILKGKHYDNLTTKIENDLSIASTILDDPNQDWIKYIPRNKMIVLDKIYPEGIMIPKKLLETNIIHLPTVKTHVFTTITGAMKNAFGGLLHQNRHWAHADIHNTLVDLLTIQYEIHQNIFAVMDGTFAGDGPGPRAMNFKVKNMILASHDQVAIDSISAKLTLAATAFRALTTARLSAV